MKTISQIEILSEFLLTNSCSKRRICLTSSDIVAEKVFEKNTSRELKIVQKANSSPSGTIDKISSFTALYYNTELLVTIFDFNYYIKFPDFPLLES